MGLIQRLTFKKEYRCFRQGTSIEFKPTINLLVGDQGSGKSTIFHAIVTMDKKQQNEIVDIVAIKGQFYAFDFEKSNHRMQSHFSEKMDYGFQTGIRFISHGEYQRHIFKALETAQDAVILMDEPDTAMSPRSCYRLNQLFQNLVEKQGCQIIAMCHNPLIFSSQTEVFNMETMSWMPPNQYMESHKIKEKIDP